MAPKARIIMLQKQLSIATKALRDIRDDGISWTVAEAALDEIERISFQEGRAALLTSLPEGEEPC